MHTQICESNSPVIPIRALNEAISIQCTNYKMHALLFQILLNLKHVFVDRLLEHRPSTIKMDDGSPSCSHYPTTMDNHNQKHPPKI